MKKILYLFMLIGLFGYLSGATASATDGCIFADDVCDDDDQQEETPPVYSGSDQFIKWMQVTSPDIIDSTLGRYGDAQSGVHTITWNSPTLVKKVNILYTLDRGLTYHEIAAGVENTGSFVWTLPEINHDSVMIRVSGLGADGWNYGSDLSNAPFTIRNAA